MSACEKCKNGQDCDKHPFIKKRFINMLKMNNVESQIIEEYTNKSKKVTTSNLGGQDPMYIDNGDSKPAPINFGNWNTNNSA